MADRRRRCAVDPRAFSPGPGRAGVLLCALGFLAALVLPPAWAGEAAGALRMAASGIAPEIGAPDGAADSPLGSYLAARFARAAGDTAAAADFFGEALAADPENGDLLNHAFRVSLADGRVEEAVRLAGTLVKTRPPAALANVVLAAAALQEGGLEAALARLDKASRRGFAELAVPTIAAWCLAGRGRPDAAVRQLAGLPQRESFAAFRLYHTAMIHDLAGRAAEAEAAYREGLGAAGSAGARIAEALGNFLERAGRAEEAQAVYDEILKDDPFDVVFAAARERAAAGTRPASLVADATAGAAEAFFGLAGVLARDATLEEALIHARLAVFLRPDFPVAQALLGHVLESAGRWEDANAQYEAIDPASPRAWQARLRIAANLGRLERTGDAIALLRELAGQRIDRTDTLISLGDLFRAQERWAEAVREYDRALRRRGELTESDWTLLYTRGIALERSRQWDRAEADFLRALELKPDQPLVLNYLAYSWVEQGRHLERALGMIRRAVDLRPRDGYIVDSLGWAFYRLGRFDEAVEELERAVELRPEDPVINDHLGDAFWRAGRRTEARFQWRRALSFGPEPDLVPAIEDKLQDGLPAAEAGADGG